MMRRLRTGSHSLPVQMILSFIALVLLTATALDKRGQRLVIELPAAIPVVQADPRRSVQVLVNLLSNASKYGPDETEIAVCATVSEGWGRVAVADRGPGISPEHRGDLFRRFVQPISDHDKAQYGAGLGLSVVKAVVGAHGGWPSPYGAKGFR